MELAAAAAADETKRAMNINTSSASVRASGNGGCARARV